MADALKPDEESVKTTASIPTRAEWDSQIEIFDKVRVVAQHQAEVLRLAGMFDDYAAHIHKNADLAQIDETGWAALGPAGRTAIIIRVAEIKARVAAITDDASRAEVLREWDSPLTLPEGVDLTQ